MKTGIENAKVWITHETKCTGNVIDSIDMSKPILNISFTTIGESRDKRDMDILFKEKE